MGDGSGAGVVGQDEMGQDHPAARHAHRADDAAAQDFRLGGDDGFEGGCDPRRGLFQDGAGPGKDALRPGPDEMVRAEGKAGGECEQGADKHTGPEGQHCFHGFATVSPVVPFVA